MDQKEISSIFKAWQEVVEKKKLDPVDDKELKGKHADRDDKDIDNDGDVDSSDEYLHNRRVTVKKKMSHSRSGKLGGHNEAVEVDNDDKDGMTKCAECGGSSENHDPDCSKAASSEKKKAMKEKDMDTTSARGAMKHDCATHVASESWGYGECIPGEHTLVEQEDGSAIVTHYDVMFEHGIEFNVPVEDLQIMAEKSHLHAAKKVKEDVETEEQRESTALDELSPSTVGSYINKRTMGNRGIGTDTTDRSKSSFQAKARAAKKAGDQAGAAKHTAKAKKVSQGLSRAVARHHAQRTGTDHLKRKSVVKGVPQAYKDRAKHGPTQNPHKAVGESVNTVEELHNEVENAYMQSAVDAIRRMGTIWEKAVQTKQGPEGKDRQSMFDPDQQNSYDKIKADHGLENPEVVKDGEKIEKEKTAGVTKQASARGSADNLGNGDKKPVKQGA